MRRVTRVWGPTCRTSEGLGRPPGSSIELCLHAVDIGTFPQIHLVLEGSGLVGDGEEDPLDRPSLGSRLRPGESATKQALRAMKATERVLGFSNVVEADLAGGGDGSGIGGRGKRGPDEGEGEGEHVSALEQGARPTRMDTISGACVRTPVFQGVAPAVAMAQTLLAMPARDTDHGDTFSRAAARGMLALLRV